MVDHGGTRSRLSSHAVLDSLFEGAGFGLAAWDLEMVFLRVNRALAEINGLPVEDHVGRRATELLPQLSAVVREVHARVLETGEAVRDVQVQAGSDPGSPRSFKCSYYPLREGGELCGVLAYVREVTEEVRALAAEKWLMDELRQEQAILREVFARAPAGMALLWGPELRFRYFNREAVKHLPGAEDLLGRSLLELLPDGSPVVEDLSKAVLGRGEAVQYEDEPAPVGGPGALEGKRYYTVSAVPVPDSEGTPTGVLVVGQDTTSAVRRRRELEQELEEEQRIASELEVSLMPERLPTVPGADLASAFLPAGEQHQIGGDFFDVFSVGPECWMLVIGDVCGKGAEAASLTALARYTLRATAIQASTKPSELLVALNEAIVRQRQDMCFLTAICAFLERAERGALRLTLSVAGHPPPLLLAADGTVTEVGGRGGLLGAWEELKVSEEAVLLEPGERLVLYTDGVVEAGAPDDELGQRGLAEILARAPQGRAADTVSAIEMAVVSRPAPARDDVAVLVVRADPSSARGLERAR